MKNKIVGCGILDAPKKYYFKKVFGLLLSLVMLFSITAGIDLSAYAAGWSSYAQKIEFDTVYTESASTADFYIVKNGRNHYYDSFIFNVPIKGNITLNVESGDDEFYTAAWTNYRVQYYIYKANDVDNYIWSSMRNGTTHGYSSGRDIYYATFDFALPAGNYYLVAEYDTHYADNIMVKGEYDFSLSYKPSLGKPSNFKVSSRKTTSLKLSWKKVGGASGYQIQQKKSGKWKTIKNTTSNAYTVSKLKAGTSYQFRVRTYKTISGKKYYGSWVTLTTPTKPATVTLSSVKSKKSKQFTAKWKKVTGSGYQVQYSTSKNFSKNKKTVTVSKNSTTSKTISKLKGKKKYYVRVRAYKTVNGTKYCGAWSKTKAVTTKR
ncbi:MAG: fibronectin type III domain-containing protein [Eubacterium sp.]|nr:fibronectin type III domain-containing protein [Eubacterium sp.]